MLKSMAEAVAPKKPAALIGLPVCFLALERGKLLCSLAPVKIIGRLESRFFT